RCDFVARGPTEKLVEPSAFDRRNRHAGNVCCLGDPFCRDCRWRSYRECLVEAVFWSAGARSFRFCQLGAEYSAQSGLLVAMAVVRSIASGEAKWRANRVPLLKRCVSGLG